MIHKSKQGRANINFYNCDNITFMKSKPDNFYKLAIVDPPYGIGASAESRVGGSYTVNLGGVKKKVAAKVYTKKDWDFIKPVKEYWDELIRVSENRIVWGGNYFISNLKETSCWIVWNKKNGDNNNADCELAWSSFDTAVRMFEWKWNGMLQQNMKNKETRIHPTQKPAALYKWLLTNYAKPNDNILDTHGGSASIALACWDLGFDLDLCELDEDYFNDSWKRFETHSRQQQLF